MKKLFIFLAAAVLTASVFAQSPQKMSYQAVVRDGSNVLVQSSQVGMQISILQGATPVYVETQTPTTNTNGLITVEIGGGNIVSGVFANIDWSAGPYFIKTETDPTGGTAYTITGTSQLLSVPYALHAKTAESVSGTVTETDPVFGAAIAAGITGADTTKWNNKQVQLSAGTGIDITGNVISATGIITETDPVFGAATAAGITGADTTKWNNKQVQLSAGTGIDITGNVISATGTVTETDPVFGATVAAGITGADTTKWNNKQVQLSAGTGIDITGNVISAIGGSGNFTHYIGELFGGGIVVAVWKEAGVEKGLIASLVDISAAQVWSNVSATLIGVTAQSPFDGQANTTAIIGQAGHTSSAAGLCDAYSNGGFIDWYLPSVWELNQCYNAAFIVNTILGTANGFQFDFYWTSNENGNSWARTQDFVLGNTNFNSKSGTSRVRAVRRF